MEWNERWVIKRIVMLQEQAGNECRGVIDNSHRVCFKPRMMTIKWSIYGFKRKVLGSSFPNVLVHTSWIFNKSGIREVVSTGNGDDGGIEKGKGRKEIFRWEEDGTDEGEKVGTGQQRAPFMIEKIAHGNNLRSSRIQ
ncbi:uncharacterized protein PGTG_03040 [Puccinia graminis f. sp. tritici CRL 75-36-700-3]|uniref:Uncharacterized protein n=1 Tax=Puccinia graminis f. sp. tritici (strain CRL 75-36-700-3 / race SCCL) TaxID=418459 RepID=E3JYF9_PUCGT|nr:uncharacterized protein PGTG_03040 [Puccinia graminis f. sp. tritici CRL 75-36-700-3]EFP77084.1 hypothetical protein PGTG_03040 [Puccinia graminis f. sp. tritici CRL 75-36-700-3]